MALSWVIGTLPFPILKLSAFQGEGEHVLWWGRDSESEIQKACAQSRVRRTEGKCGTYNIGALGLESICATHIQVGCIVRLQEADEIETLRLVRKTDPGKR